MVARPRAAGVRVELVWHAVVWMFLLGPGLLAVNLFFPAPHPFSNVASRFGVATVLTLVPLAILGWTGCMVHFSLTTYMWIYAIVYLGLVAGLAHFLAHKKTVESETVVRWPAFELGLDSPKLIAGIVLLCIGVVLVGVVMASPPSGDLPDAERYDRYARPDWWHGVAVGAVGSLLGGIALLATSLGRQKPAEVEGSLAPEKQGHGSKPRKTKKGSAGGSPANSLNWLAALIWIAAGLMTVHLMRVVFSESVPVESKRANTLMWNVDDVAYVSEATDYLYGLPMGKFEPSTGAEAVMGRGAMSPLTAPLVAMIAKLTGVSPPGLHHSLMPPLMMLIGASCLASVLGVIFRNDRWLVPLGVMVALMLIFKSWDYARCEVEMIAFRAMQTKAIHLTMVQPLQLASLLLLATRPGLRHLILAICVAIVGHTTHPLATINGMVWSTALVAGAVLFDRKSIVYLLVVLVFSCGLAGVFHLVNQSRAEGQKLSSGRVEGEPLQSRDLVRLDEERATIYGDLQDQLNQSTLSDEVRRALSASGIGLPKEVTVEPEADGVWAILYGKRPLYRIRSVDSNLVVYQCDAVPIAKHDPFWSFGFNTLYTGSALAVPILLAFGLRRREVFYLGWLGAAVLVSCNFEPLGHLLNKALPMSIFWRGRWMVPQLVSVATLIGVVYWGVGVLIRGDRKSLTPVLSLVAAIVSFAGVGIMLAKTTSMPLKAGPAPKNLTKFSDDMHGLVDILGGVEAAPYVFGPFFVQHELPQLMPNLQLVFSRDKFMRKAEAEDFRRIALGVYSGFRSGQLDARLFDRFCELYPIDHVVIDRPVARNGNGRVRGNLAKMLSDRGWTELGWSGRYQVWRREN